MGNILLFRSSENLGFPTYFGKSPCILIRHTFRLIVITYILREDIQLIDENLHLKGCYIIYLTIIQLD